MDDKFRLVFAPVHMTPMGCDYLAADAAAFDTLPQAVTAAQADEDGHVPYISHRHVVFDPHAIAILHAQFVAPVANG